MPVTDIPFYSQHAEDVPEEWRRRVCGIIALRMALERGGRQKLDPEVLITNGVSNGAYIQGVGWRHDGLIRLAKAHGVDAHRKEFKILDEGIAYIKNSFAKGETAIVSVRVDGMQDTHLMLFTKAGEQNGELGLYHHDSAQLTEESGADLFMTEKEFKRRWRGLAIFVS